VSECVCELSRCDVEMSLFFKPLHKKNEKFHKKEYSVDEHVTAIPPSPPQLALNILSCMLEKLFWLNGY
jgi:hypothetical protein